MTKEAINDPYFMHAQIHQKQLIGILEEEAGFTFYILLPGSVEEAKTHYPNLETALSAAIERTEKNYRWITGFSAYQRGESLPEVANPDFIRGWESAYESYGGEPASVYA